MTSIQDASTPVDEAAIPSSSTRPADSPSRRDDLNGLISRSQRFTAANCWLRARLDSLAAWCRELTGEIEWDGSIAQHRRGYLGAESTCRVCRLDVHDFGEMCHEQRAAQCSACGHDVLLDYYLNHKCPTGRPTHSLHNVRKVSETEWRRLLREKRIRERMKKSRN